MHTRRDLFERPVWAPDHVWNSPELVRFRQQCEALLRAIDGSPLLRPKDLLVRPEDPLGVEHILGPRRAPSKPVPPALAPRGRPTIVRPKGLHHKTFARLVREHDRLGELLRRLPQRRCSVIVRKRLDTQFRNRLTRIRRRLGLHTPEPPRQRWYRISGAAALLGVSTRTVLRWAQAGLIKTYREGDWAHRYFEDADLRNLRARLRE